MNSSQPGTHLGNYLRETRLSRGYTNVNEYLRKYQLPISYVYYRDIEIGKRKIGLESAKVLCEALKVDYRVFYSHLLKDLLPDEVMDYFVHLIPQADNESSKGGNQPKELQYVLSETKQSIKQLNESFNEERLDPSLHHGVAALTVTSHNKVLNRIADLLAEISQTQDGETLKGAKPYFYSVILASRPEYRRQNKKTTQKMGKTVP